MSESSIVLDRAFAEAKRLCYAGLEETTLLREVIERARCLSERTASTLTILRAA